MTLKLDRQTVAGRLHSLTSDHYSFIYGMMKSIALGVGAVILLPLIGEPLWRVPKLAFWAASVAAIMVSYVTTARGVVLTGFRCSWLDVVVPLGMGIVECLLFLVLQPVTASAIATPDIWRRWPFILSIHMFCAVLVVVNRLAMAKANDFEDELVPLIRKYKRWLKEDIVGAGFCGVAFGAIDRALNGAWLTAAPPTEDWYTAAGVFAFALMAVVIIKAERERSELVATMEALSASELVPSATPKTG